MPLKVEVAQRFFDGLVLGFLEGFLELAVEDVFLLALGYPGIAELVFALLGLIGDEQDGFAGGVGFQSLEFYVLANRAKIRDWTFTNLTNAESFFQNNVIDLGSNLGPAVDLTFGYKLIADGSGGFGFDFAVADPPGVSAVPEPSTWTMLLIGFAGLGFTAYRRARTEKLSWRP